MENKFKILVRSAHSIIYIISDTEIGKVHSSRSVWTDMEGNVIDPPFPDRNTIDEQIRLLQFANKINDLVVKFVRKDEYQGNEMLVMERLYPMTTESFTRTEIENFMADFETKLKDLHQNGFIHGDIIRPRLPKPECFENIILTKDGFRLIDADFSISLDMEHVRAYVRKQIDEEAELELFMKHFLEAN